MNIAGGSDNKRKQKSWWNKETVGFAQKNFTKKF